MKTIDIYIIKKFLGTFFFTLILLIFIVIVFDISEKIDDFLKHDAPLSAIAFEYYLNFVPYFINLFSYLLTFIAVIFFTSRMASDSEIVAILSSGISFRRLMYPYFISAIVLGLLSFVLANFVIPYTNISMFAFEKKYIKEQKNITAQNIHKQVNPGTFIYIENFDTKLQRGWKFTIEQFNGKELTSKLMADQIAWDTTHKRWTITNYFQRLLGDSSESITRGNSFDTVMPFAPKDFMEDIEEVKTMNYFVLTNHIAAKVLRGDPDVIKYKVKKYERIASPFATIILTVIGVSVSSRKVRGGIGFHLGSGLALTFLYILFMQVFTVFATFGDLPPLPAVWIPNVIFGLIAFILYKSAPK